MDRAWKSGASATPPAAPGSFSIGYPSPGNPTAAVPSTKPGAWWFHMVTEELRNAIVASGITPSSAELNQLEAAVRALALKAAVDVGTDYTPGTVGHFLGMWKTPQHEGVVGLGDDAALFRAAIDRQSAAGGGVVFVPPGEYIWLTPVPMKSNVTVWCAKGVVINGDSVSTGDLIDFTGTTGSEFSFSASATRGDTTVALAGSPSFNDDDILHLVSYASVFAAGAYNLGYHPTDICYYAEWNVVADVLGSGVYRLAVPFEFPGWTTSAKAKRVTPCQNAHWIGGTIVRSSSGGDDDSVFTSAWAYNCTVRNVTIRRGSRNGFAVEWRRSWKCEAINVTSENDPKLLFNYDLLHARLNRFKTVGTQDCGFVGPRASFAGQAVDFTYSNSAGPYSNIRSYCRDGIFHRCFEGLTSHQGCYQEQWIDNEVTDCYDDGLVVRGYMPTVQGNTFSSTVDVTDDLVFTAGTFVVGRRYQITTVGTTNFTAIGAASNTVGVYFVATGVGTGTGTATQNDTYAVRLAYGGARRGDISGNKVCGFYGAFGLYGSPTLGEWDNVLSNIHGNDVALCFVGLTATGMGNTNDVRFVTYQGNRHSAMGRWVVQLPSYNAGCTIKDNVLDGGFRYTGAGSYVAFVDASTNCPTLTVTGNRWLRTKGSNAGYTKYFVTVGAITDTATFPKADWAAQTVSRDNVATWDTDASFTYNAISVGSGYYQAATPLPDAYSSTIASGVAEAIPSAHRVFYVNVDTEGGAATDNLDQLVPYANCFFQEGDVCYLRSSANARDVVIRDVTVTGVAANGFQTPGDASITLGSGNDVLTCLYTGTHWAVASQSLNN